MCKPRWVFSRNRPSCLLIINFKPQGPWGSRFLLNVHFAGFVMAAIDSIVITSEGEKRNTCEGFKAGAWWVWKTKGQE